MDEREGLDSITKQVIGGAIDVHRALGPVGYWSLCTKLA